LLVSLYQEEQGSRVLSRKEPPRDGGGGTPCTKWIPSHSNTILSCSSW